MVRKIFTFYKNDVLKRERMLGQGSEHRRHVPVILHYKHKEIRHRNVTYDNKVIMEMKYYVYWLIGVMKTEISDKTK